MALNHLSLLRPLLCQSLVRQLRSPLVASSSRVGAPLLCPSTTHYPAACTRLYATKKTKGQRWSSRSIYIRMWATWLDVIYPTYESRLLNPSVPLFIFLAKAKGQAAKVNINSALVEDIISLDEVKEDMTAILSSLKDDFTRNLSIRTSPGILLDSPSYVFSLLSFASKLSWAVTRMSFKSALYVNENKWQNDESSDSTYRKYVMLVLS